MSILSRVCLRSISLRIPLDERLVPVSRLDYQNIILYIYMRVCVRHCYRQKRKADFVPASKRIEMILNRQTK